MKWTILGSGGCMVIPKPLCQCRVCREARKKGIPYARSGPSAFLHDINLLIDTPAEIVGQLNRASIRSISHLMFSHLDPDHLEGFRLVEQIALDFRSWQGYPEKRICLLLPEELCQPLGNIRSQYGSVLDFYVASGFLELKPFHGTTTIANISITAIPVDRGSQLAFIYVFEQRGRRVVYAPCDIKPFPEHRAEVHNAELLIIQPGIFEDRLKHGFKYPPEHISRTTLYTFKETMELATRLEARQIVFVHLEEYWNRSYDDYQRLSGTNPRISFAHDGMVLRV